MSLDVGDEKSEIRKIIPVIFPHAQDFYSTPSGSVVHFIHSPRLHPRSIIFKPFRLVQDDSMKIIHVQETYKFLSKNPTLGNLTSI